MASARSSILVCSVGCAVALTTGTRAMAQGDPARAEALFRQGRELLDKRDFEHGCPTLAESTRLDPSSGGEIALGLCYEGLGKIASAWAAFTQAAALANRDRREDRAVAATTEAQKLESRLPRVTFDVATDVATLPGFELRQDGEVIGRPGWTNGPVDAGQHTLEVRASGYAPYTTTFSVNDRVTVHVPPLVALTPGTDTSPPSTPPGEAQATTMPAGSPVRTAGYAVGGAGVASLLVGAVLGGVALSKASSIHAACPTNACPSQSVVNDDNTAIAMADASTVAFIAGGVLAVAGVTMVVVGPRLHRTQGQTRGWKLRVGPQMVSVEGVF
jgi:hypothetical protein